MNARVSSERIFAFKAPFIFQQDDSEHWLHACGNSDFLPDGNHKEVHLVKATRQVTFLYLS